MRKEMIFGMKNLKVGVWKAESGLSFLVWEIKEVIFLSGVRCRVDSMVSTLDFVRKKIQGWFLFYPPHHHLLVKLHLLIWRSPRNQKKGAWISHLEPLTWASTLAKEDPIRTSSGWSVEIRPSVWLHDINERFVPYLSIVVIIDPWKGDEFWTQSMWSKG